MKRRLLGKTGLEVSEIGFGAWPICGNAYGVTDDKESIATLRAAFEGGVNFFDTADIYGEGRSEDLIKKAMGDNRKKIMIASKCGWDFYSEKFSKRFDLEHVERACLKTMERLGTDYLDLYQYHNPSLEQLKDPELYEPLRILKQKGMIRHFGISVHTPEEGMAAIEYGGVESLQVICNVIDQRPIKALFPVAEEKGVGIIVREAFACGLLTGKYDKQSRFQGEDHRKRWKRKKIEGDLERLARMREFMPVDVPLPLLALEFVLAQEAVSTVIPGAKTVEQVQQNMKASNAGHFSPVQIEQMRHLYETDPLYQEEVFQN